MFGSDESQAYVAHLQSEHNRLRQHLRRVQAALDGGAAAEAGRGLSFELETLRDELRHHFAEEESGGCIEEAVARHPSLASDARCVEREHGQLLTELDEIIRCTGAERPLHIHQRFREFISHVEAHEHDETRLLEQGFNVSLEDTDV